MISRIIQLALIALCFSTNAFATEESLDADTDATLKNPYTDPGAKRERVARIVKTKIPLEKEKFEIKSAWAKPSLGKNPHSAMYVTIHNAHDVPFTILSTNVYVGPEEASSTVSNNVEMHTTRTENGVTKMISVGRVVVPANETMVMKPGGMHIMLLNLKQQLKVGDKLYAKFFIKDYGMLQVEAPVLSATPK